MKETTRDILLLVIVWTAAIGAWMGFLRIFMESAR